MHLQDHGKLEDWKVGKMVKDACLSLDIEGRELWKVLLLYYSVITGILYFVELNG